jgi:hypothetical protein
MLERVALHQTRLRTPGLSLDARGIAMGTHGLLLFPTIDRLVAFFAVFTQVQTLDDLVAGLRVELVRSKLGAREVALIFLADSSDRMDAMAEVAGLAGGHTFTGGGRYWVQYRDAAAPYGYDMSEVSTGGAAYLLHHRAYSQAFDVERPLELRQLFLRLRPHLDPSAGREPGPRWVLCEWGLGGALIHYLRRSEVQARVGLCEWPPPSALEDTPVRRFLFDIPQLPARMVTLLTRTPGITMFVPASQGAAVEVGFRHPVQLRAVPTFRPPSLVLFRGRSEAPLEIPRLPALGALEAFARIELARGGDDALQADRPLETPQLRIPLRLVPTIRPLFDVSATWVEPEQLQLLRKLLYALGTDSLRRSSIAVAPQGAFVRAARGAQVVPLGTYYRAVAPGIYVPAGYETVPAVSPRTLASSIDVPDGSVVILRADASAWVLPESSFVSLEAAIVEGPAWAPLDAARIGGELSAEVPRITVEVEDPGGSPMRDVDRAKGPPA